MRESYLAMLDKPEWYVITRTKQMEDQYKEMSKNLGWLGKDVIDDLRISLLEREISSNKMDKERRLEDQKTIEKIINLLDSETAKHETELSRLKEVRNAQG